MKKIVLFLLVTTLLGLNASGQKIRASYSNAVFNGPFTGKVIAYFSKENKSPKDGAVGLESFPCFSVDVKNIKPNEEITFDDSAISYPCPLSDIERGDYYVQIVWDRNLGGRSIANSPGNLFNTTQSVHISKNPKAVFKIVADRVVPNLSFRETEFVKELKATIQASQYVPWKANDGGCCDHPPQRILRKTGGKISGAIYGFRIWR